MSLNDLLQVAQHTHCLVTSVQWI